MLTETPVSCMPKDNHKPLLFKTAGKHIRKKKKKMKAQLWNPLPQIKLQQKENSEQNVSTGSV